MKWIRFGLVSLFVLAMSTAAMADEKTDAKPAAGKSTASAKWNGSPEDMAKSALAKWKDVLKLTPEQQPQFESVMKASYEKMAEDRKDAAGDKAKMKASMESNLNDREAALAKILTPDQMKIYQAKMKEMAGKAKHWNKEAAKTETKTNAKSGEK
jgi:hypothetical protein